MPILSYRGKEYEYDVRLSKRAKRMSFAVHWDGRCELVIPEKKIIPAWAIKRFIWTHRAWVAENTAKQKKNADKIPLHHQGVPTELVRERTLDLVHVHIENYCNLHPFKINGIKVRSYKTRWGSCSQNNRLCFHYKLSLLPRELAEYVVIHELCHTIHFDHSREFWQLVSEFCPEFKQHRKKLKQYLV